LTGKRKLTAKADAPIKRSKFPSYFISELAHVVAFVDDRIPFDNLALGTVFNFSLIKLGFKNAFLILIF
jgi:hypothetical protein